MQKHLRVALAAFSLMIATSARAGEITNLQLYDGSSAPTATIFFTHADGTGSSSENVYADPQVSGGTTSPMFYCVDLWHDNYIGQTYPITQVSGMEFSNSTLSDPGNRIGWLLTQDLVSVAPGGVVITTAAVPEPSSAVLSSISVLFFSVLHWWRRIG